MKQIKKWFTAQAAGRYVLLLAGGLAVEAAGYRLLEERNGWVYFVLGLVGLAPIALFLNNRAVVHLFGLACIIALMFGVYWIDSVQETDREEVLRIAEELTRAVERVDFAVIERYLAPDFQWQGMDRKGVLDRARRSLSPDGRRNCSITTAQVQGRNGDAELTVSGNLTATGDYGVEINAFVGVVDMKFVRQADGRYKLTGVKVSTLRGEEVSVPGG